MNNIAIEFAKWIADFQSKEENGFSDHITLIDGNYYWNGDNDGDQPLKEEILYDMFIKERDDKGKNFNSPALLKQAHVSGQLQICQDDLIEIIDMAQEKMPNFKIGYEYTYNDIAEFLKKKNYKIV